MSNLLATKFYLPSPPPKRLQRPHLVQYLNDGLEYGRHLTLVSAPAGFGKTTCIREWVNGLHHPITWLSLDPADDDPGRFFSYLLAALQKVDETLGREIQGVLNAGQLPPAEVITTCLINDMLHVRSQFLLVLDDFHVIQDPIILRVFEELVLHFPESLHLVLLTREDPALPLARLRANNHLTEIRADDLRFSRLEADHFLQEVMDLCLSEVDVALLDERTEGWVVGLQLAGLSLRGRPDPSRYITSLSGSHRNILNYLTEEVLDQQPEDTQQFLLRTSILDKLNGDLCNTLTGRSDSAVLLDQLYDSNLFLISLDDEQRWYRYHHLFAEMLRSRQKALLKEETADLHRRASRWYSEASQPSLHLGERTTFASEAIQHAISAEDYATAVKLIESHALVMLMQWHSKTVSEWIQSIPPQWSLQSPKVNLTFAWMHLLHGSFLEVSPYLERLQVIFSNNETSEDASLRAEWLALQATLICAQGKAVESLELARRALEIVPEQDGYVRSQIYSAIAGAYKQMDDYPHAVEAYQSLIHYGRAAGNILFELIGISSLALMVIEHGQLHYGYNLATQGEQQAEAAGVMPPICAGIFGELGQIHYQWNQLDQAQTYFERAAQVSVLSGFSDAEIFHAVVRSRLALLRGDLDTAEKEIQTAVERMRVDAPTVVREEVIHQQIRALLARHHLAAAEAAATAALAGEKAFSDFPTLPVRGNLADLMVGGDFSYPKALLKISVLRILLYKALDRSDPAGLREAVALADMLIEALLKHQFIPIVLEALLLQAQMHEALGNKASSLADILQALSLAEPEGFISVFVEGGFRTAEQLENKQLGNVQPAYVKTILAAFPFSRPSGSTIQTPPQSGGLVERLTERELEVLRLMVEGKTYGDMAGRLVVSINTIRTHIKSIYGKLGVNNRTAAIEAAREMNIL